MRYCTWQKKDVFCDELTPCNRCKYFVPFKMPFINFCLGTPRKVLNLFKVLEGFDSITKYRHLIR